MKKLLFPVICLAILTQCKKSNDNPDGGDYLPLTIGSNWTYLSNGTTSTITVSSKDTVALGRTYKVFTNSNGPNQYHVKSGNEYYRFATFQNFFPNGVEELYLKSDGNVNTNWQFSVNVNFGGIPIPVTASYTITEKGITKNVQGKNYTDVVHVVMTLSSGLGNGDFYYAKGVGMISSSLNITVPGSTTSNTAELTAYEIK